jgi:hypothetical protein
LLLATKKKQWCRLCPKFVICVCAVDEMMMYKLSQYIHLPVDIPEVCIMFRAYRQMAYNSNDDVYTMRQRNGSELVSGMFKR